MYHSALRAGLFAGAVFSASFAMAAELAIVSGDSGNGLAFLQSQLKEFEAKTGNTVKIVPMPPSTSDQFGQYRLWLAAGNADIDVYMTDVIWAPQLSDQFLDLTDAAKDIVKDHFPSIIESQTANGKTGLPFPPSPTRRRCSIARDLLDKYGKQVPKTWDEMAATAKEIQDKETRSRRQGSLGLRIPGQRL